MSLYIGVDAGGTMTRLLARGSNSHSDLHFRAGGANLMRDGEEKVVTCLMGLIDKVSAARPGEEFRGMVAGVAGAGHINSQRTLAEKLREALGDKAPPVLEIVHDGVIALDTAFPNCSGMLVIAGTGSALISRTKDGQLARVGGWGYLIGDEGSGYTIGKRGLSAVAHALDGGPYTTLVQRLADNHDINGRYELIKSIFREQWALQAMAPIVLEAATEGDTVAMELLQSEVSLLVQQASWLYAQAPNIKRQICLSGGLSRSKIYRKAFVQSLRKKLPDFELCRSEIASTYGAVRLAQLLHEKKIDPPSLRVSDSDDYQ